MRLACAKRERGAGEPAVLRVGLLHARDRRAHDSEVLRRLEAEDAGLGDGQLHAPGARRRARRVRDDGDVEGLVVAIRVGAAEEDAVACRPVGEVGEGEGLDECERAGVLPEALCGREHAPTRVERAARADMVVDVTGERKVQLVRQAGRRCDDVAEATAYLQTCQD